MKIGNKALLGAAVAGILGATLMTQAQAADKKGKGKGGCPELVKCYGVNKCSASGKCGGAGHACAGQNSCKGQGWLQMPEDACKALEGGSTTPPSKG